MRGFKKLVLLGVLLATLLVIIDTIDAKKKDNNKKNVGGKSEKEYGSKKDGKFEKIKKSESFKSEKYKKSNSLKEENVSENKQYFTEDSKIETKNYKVKRGTKYTKKDSETIEEGVNPKITKTFQKVKKYKIVEDNPTEKYFSSKTKAKKTKSQVEQEETVDEVFQSVKKAHKKAKGNDNLEDIIQEGLLNQLNNNDENVILEEETSGSNPRRKKYKLVEVILEEDGEEEKEVNETIIGAATEEEEMGGILRTEREEVIEKFKTTHSVKMPKLNKKPSKKESVLAKEEEVDEKCPMKSEASDSEVVKGSLPDKVESASTLYEEPEAYESCVPASDDQQRTGPKKLTLYVIEEEVDGEVTKRVVSEEDGVSMCEVADLLKDHYYAGLP